MNAKFPFICFIILAGCFSIAYAQMVLTPVYDSRSGLWGYTNDQNALVIPYTYHSVAPFKEELAYVILNDDSKTEAFINSKGQIVLVVPEELNLSYAGQMVGEGLIAAYQISTGLYGYIDMEGKVIHDFKYQLAYPFSEGLAAVVECLEYHTESPDGWLSGNFDCKASFIDKSGETVLSFPADFHPDISVSFNNYSFEFHEGLVAVQNRNTGLWGYMDRRGELVIPAKFNIALQFSEGKAFTAILSNTYMNFTGENQIGYIDNEANYVIKLPHQLANLQNGCYFSGSEFRNGKAVMTIVENDGDCVNFGKIVIDAFGKFLSEDWE